MNNGNPKHCKHACITRVPIFNHLENEQMAEIMQVTKSFSYKKGEFIYGAGDLANALYIVARGKIKIYRLSATGKEQLVRILNPGDFTGELALFKESTHQSYAQALEDSQVCVITRVDLQQFLMKYPSISLRILSEFAQRLEVAEKRTTRFATEKVETRIAHFLAECVDREEPSPEFVLPLTKKDLASYLGTTPETLSRKLKNLEEAGYIKQTGRRKIKILDLNGLLMV